MSIGSMPSCTIVVMARGTMNAAFWMSSASLINSALELWRNEDWAFAVAGRKLKIRSNSPPVARALGALATNQDAGITQDIGVVRHCCSGCREVFPAVRAVAEVLPPIDPRSIRMELDIRRFEMQKCCNVCGKKVSGVNTYCNAWLNDPTPLKQMMALSDRNYGTKKGSRKSDVSRAADCCFVFRV